MEILLLLNVDIFVIKKEEKLDKDIAAVLNNSSKNFVQASETSINKLFSVHCAYT